TDDNGLVTRMNFAAQQILGWTIEEARGRPLDDVYQRIDDETRQPIRTGVEEVIQRGRILSQPRYPLLTTRDGATPCALVESIAPIYGDEGVIEGAMLVFRDENRERAHGQALEASQARTAAILEASLDAVVTIDAAGAITEFNGAAERMFGYDRDAVIGLGFADLVLPARLGTAYSDAVQRDLATGETHVLGKRNEMVALRVDGTEFPVEMVLARIPVEGAVSFTCFIRDLTAAKRSEEALRRSHQQLRALAGRVEAAREEERTRIARELHDELGQTLTAIRMDLGWLVLRTKSMPPAVAERLDAMSQLVESTFLMVRRLGTQLRPGILDDLGLAAAIEWQAREFEGRSGIRVDVDAPADVGTLDPRYATTVFRIFQELLTNVGRHSEAKRVTARLWQAEHSVEFEVRDDGRGIRPEEAANANSLGLLGMRERATLLGGSFHIGPAEGGGTLVRVTLPREVRA
nr:PAS domain S-box protein [Deltaproteobacteria bacterium]